MLQKGIFCYRQPYFLFQFEAKISFMQCNMDKLDDKVCQRDLPVEMKTSAKMANSFIMV